MRVQSLTPHMGAEILDVRLSAVTPGQVKAIRQLLVEHMVLVFRDQELSRDEHKAFGRQFGELHVHPSKRELGARGDPEIFAVKTTPDSRFTNGEGWHSDVSCDAVPPMGSMLFVRELPGPSGGDTLFANLSLAYESLSEPMQTWLRSLTAVHDGVKDLRAYDIRLQPGQSYPHAEHPVVVRHPDSGREVLFVNRSFTERIVGLRPAESDVILEMLWRHVEDSPRYQCRVRWLPGTLLFWDNRCTWHHAVWDYYPHTRYGERVTIAGAVPPAAAGVD